MLGRNWRRSHRFEGEEEIPCITKLGIGLNWGLQWSMSTMERSMFYCGASIWDNDANALD